MFEEFQSFADYIKLYELHRSEGLLLRHLNSVYKVLAQTVPDAAKNDTFREMETYLDTLLRQVDSSLMEEWERMRNPDYQPRGATVEIRPPGTEEAAQDITRDTRAFTSGVRTRLFTFLRAWATGDADTALEALACPTAAPAQASPARASSVTAGEAPSEAPAPEDEPWTAMRLRETLEIFDAGHRRLRLDPEARNARHTYVIPAEDRRTWRVQQMLLDPDEHNDWVAEFEVDLALSRQRREAAIRLIRIGPLVETKPALAEHS